LILIDFNPSLFFDPFWHFLINDLYLILIIEFDFCLPPVFEQHEPFFFGLGIVFEVLVALTVNVSRQLELVYVGFELGEAYPDLCIKWKLL
jgi:hypothetical protein